MKDESDEKGCLILALGIFILSAIPVFIGLLLGKDVYNMIKFDANGDPINLVRYYEIYILFACNCFHLLFVQKEMR